MDGSVGADLGAVPQQAPAGLEVLTGSGCAYLVCRLPYVARRGLDLPAEAGLDDVESDGIRFVFASELRGREIFSGWHGWWDYKKAEGRSSGPDQPSSHALAFHAAPFGPNWKSGDDSGLVPGTALVIPPSRLRIVDCGFQIVTARFPSCWQIRNTKSEIRNHGAGRISRILTLRNQKTLP